MFLCELLIKSMVVIERNLLIELFTEILGASDDDDHEPTVDDYCAGIDEGADGSSKYDDCK